MANSYYTLTKTETSFTVDTNNDLHGTVVISISKTNCENVKELILEKILNSSSPDFIYNFNTYGNYEVSITVFDLDNPELNIKETLYFSNISNQIYLLDSLVDNIQSLFCGCNCQDCGEDCGKKDSDYSTVLNKLLSLNIIKDNYYTEAITQTNSCIKCDTEYGVDCELLQEKITGSSDNKEKIKKLIAYYYLVYYYKDLLESETPDNVTKQYKYNDIYKCIKHLGLDINCIKTKII
jgi:hypothetical protein